MIGPDPASRKVVTVTLDWGEAIVAAIVGVRQHLSALVKKRRDRFGWPKAPDWNQHIEGRGAELSVAKWAGLYWGGIPLTTWHGPDVGEDVQVRYRTSTPANPRPDLGVKWDDPDDHRYVLVYGAMPCCELIGWIWGREAKQPAFLHTTGNENLYYVPESALHPMYEFVR